MINSKKKIPIGISDFKELISGNSYYIDKSLFIEEIINEGSKVTLIPRPRRFGKTINLSMLKYFFEQTEEDNVNLFKDLAISKNKKLMQEQGESPVIFMTFKDIKVATWNECAEEMRGVIETEYTSREYLLEGDVLTQAEKRYFKSIINAGATNTQYTRALKNLSKYLHSYHKKRPYIFIDEYDTPIQEGFMHNYHKKIIQFMRNFLSGGLKDNSHLEKSVITGILRISKENIFSGLNNLEVCTILDQAYSDKFGWTEKEVLEISKYYNIEDKYDEIKSWYNGYMFDEVLVYNPWSILNLIKKNGRFAPYWVNTSQNALINELISEGKDELKEEFELLLSGKTIDKIIESDIVLEKVQQNPDVVWNLLLFSGYLTYSERIEDGDEVRYMLKIPNREVYSVFKNIVTGWFSSSIGSKKYNLMLKDIVAGDVESFCNKIKEFLINSISYFDTAGKNPEKVYHALVLGILIGLQDSYEIISNRESGDGRYDVMLIPKNKSDLGIVIEFKVVKKKEKLKKTAKEALCQIKNKNYVQELVRQGIHRKLLIGMAFSKKDIDAEHEFL